MMVGCAGLEPTTIGLKVRYFNQALKPLCGRSVGIQTLVLASPGAAPRLSIPEGYHAQNVS
jgi:hypothetical protein